MKKFIKKWIHFWWGGIFDLSYEVCGYFDNRPRINFGLVIFHISFIIPFYNKWSSECDPPKWGIGYHHQTLWIYIGGKGNMRGGCKWITFNMPWQFDWVRTSTLLKDNTWYHETRKNRIEWFTASKEKGTRNWLEENKMADVYDYTYILKSGKIQERKATIGVEEREWRLRGARWFSPIKSISKTISVEFNDEVGERTGSWKGGCIGCSYELLSNETPLECLRRMEKERKFN